VKAVAKVPETGKKAYLEIRIIFFSKTLASFQKWHIFAPLSGA
jgi:hypothetical protein